MFLDNHTDTPHYACIESYELEYYVFVGFKLNILKM